MKRLNLFSTGMESLPGAAALELGQRPSNNAVDTDNVVLDESGEAATPGDGEAKLAEVRELDDADAVLKGTAQEALTSTAIDKSFLGAFSTTAGRNVMSLEEELQTHIDNAEALNGMDEVAQALPMACGLTQAIEDLDLILQQMEAEGVPKPGPTRALIQVVTHSIVAGTDQDPTELAPALESETDKADRTGVIRRIIDNVVAMVRKFWAWLKSFFTSSQRLIEQEEAKMDAMKKSLQEAQQTSVPRATTFEPFEIAPLVINDKKMGVTGQIAAEGCVVFQTQFAKLLQAIDTQGISLAKLHDTVSAGRTLTAEQILAGGFGEGVDVYPGRIRMDFNYPTVPPKAGDLDLREAADVLKDIDFNCLQFAPEDPQKTAVPELRLLESLTNAYFKINSDRLEKVKAFHKRMEEIDKLTVKLEKSITSNRDARNFENVLFLADYLACLIRFQSASLRAVSLSGANFSRWMSVYLRTALKSYENLTPAE